MEARHNRLVPDGFTDAMELINRDFKELIAEIEASGVSLYKLAAMLATRLDRDFQYIQVERIKSTGRCEFQVGRALLIIHSQIVPHETLQIVPCDRAMKMQMA